MNREDRAKQFMAFDALKGLREELKKREEKYLKEQKHELTEEEMFILSQKIATLQKGDMVKITFFHNGHYVVLPGELDGVNTAFRYLGINGKRISFEDLLEVEDYQV